MEVLLAVAAASMVVAMACALPSFGRLFDSQPWPRQVALVLATYDAQLAIAGTTASFSIARATVTDVVSTDHGGGPIVDSKAFGSEMVLLPDTTGVGRLRHWMAEAIPVLMLHHFDGHVELYGPEGIVEAVSRTIR